MAYVDQTGSGVETIAHLAENGRVVVMFCASNGPPRIVRLHGTGHTVRVDDYRFASQESVVDPDTTVVVPVEARTVRGQEWLERTWTQPIEESRLALIALIQPAPGLGWTQFRDYWWDQHRPLANSIVPAKVDTVAYVHSYAAPSDTFQWAGIGEMYDESIDTAGRRAAWMSTDAAAVLIEDEKPFMNQAGRLVMVVDYEIIVSGPEVQVI